MQENLESIMVEMMEVTMKRMLDSLALILEARDEAENNDVEHTGN